MRFSPSRHRLALATALVGVALSTLTFVVHQRIGAGYTSFCNLGEVVNCDAVLGSRYGRLLGTSVAAWGLAAFAAGVLLALHGALDRAGRGRPRHRRRHLGRGAGARVARHGRRDSPAGPALLYLVHAAPRPRGGGADSRGRAREGAGGSPSLDRGLLRLPVSVLRAGFPGSAGSPSRSPRRPPRVPPLPPRPELQRSRHALGSPQRLPRRDRRGVRRAAGSVLGVPRPPLRE